MQICLQTDSLLRNRTTALRQQSPYGTLSWKKRDITGRPALGWTRSRKPASGWPITKLPYLLRQHCWPEPVCTMEGKSKSVLHAQYIFRQKKQTGSSQWNRGKVIFRVSTLHWLASLSCSLHSGASYEQQLEKTILISHCISSWLFVSKVLIN